MVNEKHEVHLKEAERRKLLSIVSKGRNKWDIYPGYPDSIFYSKSAIFQEFGLNLQFADPAGISDGLKRCLSGKNRFWVILQEASDSEIGHRIRSFFLTPIKQPCT